MNGRGQAKPVWGYAVQGKPAPLLQVALEALGRNGAKPESLPNCDGEPCAWFREIGECVSKGEYQRAVLFCEDVGLACCITNKLAGVRAAPVGTVDEANRALRWGANLLAVAVAGRTYYELKELLRICHVQTPLICPPQVAGVLQELEGHANR